MMIRSILVLSLLIGAVFVSGLTEPKFNPQGKRHAISRSTYHTSQGRVMEMDRAYENQGNSHIENGLKPYKYTIEDGVHLWEPAVYKQLQSLAMKSFNTTATLPTIEQAHSAIPEQVKLSVTQRQGELVVNWLTWNSTQKPQCRFGLSPGDYSVAVNAQNITFVDPNSLHVIRYIYNALLTGLQPSTTYYYQVGDVVTGIFSQEYELVTPAGLGTETVQTLGVFGDMGVVNSQSMQALTEEVLNGSIQLVLHLGDYAYNMDELQGLTGDIFLEEMTNITSRVPYQGAPGNHEQAFNFSHFANKFSLFNYISDPSGQPDQNWWYSWDFQSGGSNIHVITIDSELYYWNYADATEEQKQNFPLMIQNQWNWIVEDLTQAYDSGKYDWIFAYSHRPMYCSNTDDIPDCTTDAETLRLGVPTGPNGELQWGIEAALSVRPIDLYMSAHEHSYERTLPVKNGSIDRQEDVNFYVDPLYPVHIVTGAGGCREFYDYYDEVFYGAWSVFRSSTYGYGHLIVYNSTHLYWEQLLDEGNGGKDTMWIVKKSKEEKLLRKEMEEAMKEQQQQQEQQESEEPLPVLPNQPLIAFE